MRNSGNIRQVEALAPDWMGFICWKSSPRYISDIPAYLPTSCRRVGVFVNPSEEYINVQVDKLGLDLVQLHGHEKPEFCRFVKTMTGQKGRPIQVIKSFNIATGQPFPDTNSYEGICNYFLFDTQTSSVGGSGLTFDWNLLHNYRGNTPFLLSGGIGPNSLPALEKFSHPYWIGVDLNSRFETSPAWKNPEQLAIFLKALRK